MCRPEIKNENAVAPTRSSGQRFENSASPSGAGEGLGNGTSLPVGSPQGPGGRVLAEASLFLAVYFSSELQSGERSLQMTKAISVRATFGLNPSGTL